VTTLPPYWYPQSEADIQRAIDDGLLSETHYLDCKRQVGASQGERKETARDLASFAIDGGRSWSVLTKTRAAEPSA
jgi:hypothetical protein